MFLQDEVGKNILDDKECWRDVSLVWNLQFAFA
jgi:hypothetical protein